MEAAVRLGQRRRIDKRPKRIRVLLKRLFQALSCVFVFFAVAYSVFWCLDPAHFPIASVRFVGERKHLSRHELQEVIFAEVNTGFFGLKVSSLQHHLLLLPWIKQVDVRKIWPDQLVIHFEEHKPAAFWGDNGMISDVGTLFYPDLSKIKMDLPMLQGPEGRASSVWQQFLVMEQTLAPLDLTITNLTLAPRGAWHLRLSNGITVVLGTNDILTRLRRFVHAYEKQLHTREQEMAYVDLRYTSGMSVGWKTS